MRFASGLDQYMMVLVHCKADGAWIVLVENLNPEPVKRLRLVAPCETFRVERLMGDGSWSDFASSNEDSSLPATFLWRSMRRRFCA